MNSDNKFTNPVHDHQHEDKETKSMTETNTKYPEKFLIPAEGDKIIIVVLNPYKEGEDIYERARGNWALTENKVRQCTHVLAVYHGVVQAVYPVEPNAWEMISPKGNHKSARWRFTATEDENSPYLYTKIYSEVTELVDKDGNPISRRKKVDANGKSVSPRRGAWSYNY